MSTPQRAGSDRAPRGAELDVRREEHWRELVSFTVAEFGPPTVLVNNAGVASYGRLLQLSEEEYRRVIDINQVGVFLGMRAVAPAMIEAGGGSIINIASVEGLVGGAGLLAYTASKHAVVGMTKVAALEFATLGVRVNAVAPGPVDTPMMDAVAAKGVDVHTAAATATPIGRIARPEEITAMVVFLASDQSTYCTGSTYNVDGGWVAR